MAGRMYGERATELVRDLRRFDTLPAYNEAVVREVGKEITALFAENAKTLKESPEDASAPESMFALLLNHASIHRDKRIILAYLNFRLKKLQALRWDRGSSVLPPEVQVLVSEEERAFWTEYDRNVAAYMKEFPLLDLSSDVRHPPKELNIQVRVLRDYPDLVMQNGATVTLQKNTLLYLPRADVEHLIKQGVLEHCE